MSTVAKAVASGVPRCDEARRQQAPNVNLRANGRFASPEDHQACRELLCDGSKSFLAASYLLPASIAVPAASLYAFCRVADDAVDKGDPHEGLQRMQARLRLLYEGRPADHPADRAFADVVRDCHMPRALPEALLDGFSWDAGGRFYEDLSDLVAYSARVAGSVGAMMTLVMGRREAAVLARACDLGVAMQLTNICRDVGEDARMGRLYLPRTWLDEAGVDPDTFLRDPQFTPALGTVIKRLLHVASVLYRRSRAGVARLPAMCRPGIHAARLIYGEIGAEVMRNGLDSVSQRAVVSTRRKLALLARALGTSLKSRPPRITAPALAETHFLVAAVHPHEREVPAPTTYHQIAADGEACERGLVWVLNLFARLEAQERQAAASAMAARRRVLPDTPARGGGGA